jgi:hypothetical protein
MKDKLKRDDLESALAEWRQQRFPELKLSQQTRARIFRAAAERHSRRIEPAVPLFFPAGRLTVATVMPLLLLLLMAGYILMPGGDVEIAANGEAPRLEAVRQGDEVIFVIANGGRSHLVRKSSSASNLKDSESFVVTDGAFRDRLDSGGDLVFYRID